MKAFTEKEKVLAQRAAWVAGAEFCRIRDIVTVSTIEREANSRYPLPKVTRRRVVVDPHIAAEWKLGDEELMWRRTGETKSCRLPDAREWQFAFVNRLAPTKERVALWADLLANSDEVVDDE